MCKMLFDMAQEVCVYDICECVCVCKCVCLCAHSSPLIKAVAFCVGKKQMVLLWRFKERDV